MPPRKASAASKAASDAKAAASVKAAAAKKTGATAAVKKTAATAAKADKADKTEKSTTAVAKRKRGDAEAAPKENGVSTSVKAAPKKAAPAAAAKKTAAAAKKAKADVVDNKENATSLANGDNKKKRAPAVSKAAAVPAKAKTTKRKASDVEEEKEEEEEERAEARPTKAARKTKDATTGKAAAAEAKAAVAEAKAKAAEAKAAAAAEKAAAKAAAKAEAAAATAATAVAVVKKPAGKVGVKINEAPTKPLDVFVFGEGGAGELGLGSVRFEGKKPIDVKRPRLNHNLAAGRVDVVQIAAGGMHAVALTKDNRILTWGVNDQGALGRKTNWEGGLRDADAEEESDNEDDTGLNPLESTPTEIDTDGLINGTKFVQVVASDSATFALTEDGRIYGWGTFRASDGVLGFSKDVSIQRTPTLLPEPRKVKALATGSNHILALDTKGKLYTWGCPEQNQLGRRCVQRDIKESALRPGGVGFRRGVQIEKIACGSYHSFAVDDGGRVYAWGLNNFGQLNVEQGAGDTDATVLDATLVEGLAAFKIVDVDGGEHHSLACTADGKLLTWGRIDGHQVGFDAGAFNKIPPVVHVNAGTDNSFALTEDGKVYSWGFSGTYQTGQGTTEDIETPTLIDNTAVREKKIVHASAGGQFSLLASEA
ncbi:ran exchange factor prp20 [Grosmannia clavigera kw1407]|uniref:Ran exchange factor prp20 n=1 Tax=Grosmannia clavigera (strain kw1407 / UAMH 11150) TaxID=655863 RepID=F0XQG2_GROCL|nr:ran exchange factor prp20 [Grosmannia clavigera kw1407]EFX00743.1 ran exchange factor prp20 [Grosmannia clavigera kw1407]